MGTWESVWCVVPRKWGNAHGGKAPADHFAEKATHGRHARPAAMTQTLFRLAQRTLKRDAEWSDLNRRMREICLSGGVRGERGAFGRLSPLLDPIASLSPSRH